MDRAGRHLLKSAWNDAFNDLGLSFEDTPDILPLLARYEEDHRHYHTLTHILRVLNAVGTLSGEVLPPTVAIAAFYHDCVYEIGAEPRANELRSALVMVGELDGVLPAYLLREISSLILATYPGDYKNPPHTLNEAILRDADLAGFAANFSVVQSNGDKIAKEFATKFAEADYIVGRDAFLQSMLDLPQIYWSPWATDDGWEEAARENIAREMEPEVKCPEPGCVLFKHDNNLHLNTDGPFFVSGRPLDVGSPTPKCAAYGCVLPDHPASSTHMASGGMYWTYTTNADGEEMHYADHGVNGDWPHRAKDCVPKAQKRCTNCGGTGQVERRYPLASHGGNADITTKPCPVCTPPRVS